MYGFPLGWLNVGDNVKFMYEIYWLKMGCVSFKSSQAFHIHGEEKEGLNAYNYVTYISQVKYSWSAKQTYPFRTHTYTK